MAGYGPNGTAEETDGREQRRVGQYSIQMPPTWSQIFLSIDSSPELNVSGALAAIAAIILRSEAALVHSGVRAAPLPVCEAMGGLK